MASSLEGLKRIEALKPQLAFALALVKQKPPHKQVKEYIFDIRKFIKHAKDSEDFERDKFFDSVSFWQNAYESSEAEQVKLLNTVFELEEKNQNLITKMQAGSAAHHEDITVASSRETFDTNITSTGLLEGPQKEGGDEIDRQGINQSGRESRLMRQIYNLQRALQKRRTPNCLVTEAVIMCKEAEWELLTAIQQRANFTQQTTSSANFSKMPDLEDIIRGLELSFTLVHQALHRVSGTKKGEQSKGQITYYLVCLFESTMTALTQYCTAISTRITSNSTQSPRSSGAKETSRKRKATRPCSEAGEKEAHAITNFLCTMAMSLNLTRPEDQQVMEGYLFLVLSRMGKVLALFVFQDLEYPSEISARLNFPQGLIAMRQEALSPQNAQLEAKCLMSFLSKVLDSRPSLLSESALARSDFLQRAKGRLQKTLLQAVFGSDEPLFQEGLIRPKTPPAQDCGSRRTSQLGFPEWFTQELWRLIGWDLLGSSVGCH